MREIEQMIKLSTKNLVAARDKGLMAVRAMPGGTGRYVKLDNGKLIVDMNRCCYLDIDSRPELIEGALKLMQDYGSVQWSAASSRVSYQCLALLEEMLGEIIGSDCFVSVASNVTSINLSALPLLATGAFTSGKRPLIVFDRRAHASMATQKPAISEQTTLETIAHNDFHHLEELCKKHQNVAYVCDGIYSMGGYTSLARLSHLQNKYNLFLYIDDAHGISIAGACGQGFAWSMLESSDPDRTIVVASLAKGFGSSGGVFTTRSQSIHEVFRRHALCLTFSNMPAVATIGASLASAKIHLSTEIILLQEMLRKRIHHWDSSFRLADQVGSQSPIRFIEFGNEENTLDVGEGLLNKGFFAGVALYPTVGKNRSGLRICMSSGLKIKTLDRLISSLNDEINSRGLSIINLS